MKIICISGKAQHGKDTSAEIIKRQLEQKGHSVLITHYGDLVKYICKAFFDWNGEKDDIGRGILQHVGTDVIRNKYPDFWVGFVVKILKLFPNKWDYVLIPDCRFPNEVEVMKDAGLDLVHWRVVREKFKSPLTEEQQNHISETALDNTCPDRYIYNRGTKEELEIALYDMVRDVISAISVKCSV